MEKNILEYYTFVFLEDHPSFKDETIAVGYSKEFQPILARIDTNIDLVAIDIKNILEVICGELDLKKHYRGKLFRGHEIRNRLGKKLALVYPLDDNDPLSDYARLHFGDDVISINVAIVKDSGIGTKSYYDISRKSFEPEGILPMRNQELPFFLYNAFSTNHLVYNDKTQ